jgi:hypothetical protein
MFRHAIEQAELAQALKLAQQSRLRPDLSGLKILVVDDEADARDLITQEISLLIPPECVVDGVPPYSELIAHRTEHRTKSLRLSHALEPLHPAFSFTRGAMGILRAIIQPPALPMGTPGIASVLAAA